MLIAMFTHLTCHITYGFYETLVIMDALGMVSTLEDRKGQ